MLPVLMLLRDLDSQGVAKPSVQKTSKLAKAIQRQHNDSCQQTTKELPKDINESRVPVTVENYGWAENPSRVQGCSCELAACRAGTRKCPSRLIDEAHPLPLDDHDASLGESAAGC